MSYKYNLGNIPSQLVWGTCALVSKPTVAETATCLKLALATHQHATLPAETVDAGLQARDDIIAHFVMLALQSELSVIENDTLQTVSKTEYSTRNLREFKIVASAWHAAHSNSLTTESWSSFVPSEVKQYEGVLVPVSSEFVEYRNHYLITAYVDQDARYIDFYSSDPLVLHQMYTFSGLVKSRRKNNVSHLTAITTRMII